MRAAIAIVTASLTIALASPNMLAQVPNPDLLEASKENLKTVAAALKKYFVDFGVYPPIVNELLISRRTEWLLSDGATH
jgi:hypothetical protein